MASSTTNTRTKFSHLQKMALEALFKESRYPSQGVIEEFAKLNNLDGATVKVWFNKGRYVFSWGGRAGEFWDFFPKKVLALPCVLMKTLLTPHL